MDVSALSFVFLSIKVKHPLKKNDALKNRKYKQIIIFLIVISLMISFNVFIIKQFILAHLINYLIS